MKAALSKALVDLRGSFLAMMDIPVPNAGLAASGLSEGRPCPTYHG